MIMKAKELSVKILETKELLDQQTILKGTVMFTIEYRGSQRDQNRFAADWADER